MFGQMPRLMWADSDESSREIRAHSRRQSRAVTAGNADDRTPELSAPFPYRHLFCLRNKTVDLPYLGHGRGHAL